MRVITGEAKGRRLKGPPGPQTRPMADKIKEAVFSTLEALGVYADRVLDLYSGTGSIGIEALSRGADWADLVDSQQAACAVIRHNLAHTRLAPRAEVHCMPVSAFLRTRRQPYDLVFLDPPYDDPEILPTLEQLAATKLVAPGSVVVLGHKPALEVPERLGDLTLLRHRCHGDSCFSIFELAEPGSTEKPQAGETAAGAEGAEGVEA